MAAAIPALTRLGALSDKRDAIDDAMFVEVGYARSMGASWRMIGVAVGTSTQAAWERYRPAPTESEVLAEQHLPFDQT